MATGDAVVVLVRGDHDASETKIQAALGGELVELADEYTVTRITGAPVGFAGPMGLSVRVIADAALEGARGMVAGANRADEHVVNLELGRDAARLTFADVRQAVAGDRCPRCDGGAFGAHRGIEVGQVFYLGTKYSEAMKAHFLGADGAERPIDMGCYGIGITRTVAAAIEQHHDANGIVWPAPLAPFGAHVIPVNVGDATLRETAEKIVAELEAQGIDTLLDDRDERPGVKFKDADLIGIPARVTIGPRALKNGCVELKPRAAGEAQEVPVGEVAKRVADLVGPR
jgi:prolyl-tRNA synthetase